ncbi:hypothetical protein ES708_31239 [subsurface metagenome]
MTIDKAIENLYHLKVHTYGAREVEAQQALKLGIEALIEVRKARYGDPALDGELLPGETKE